MLSSVSSEAMYITGSWGVPEVLFGILWCTPGSSRFIPGSGTGSQVEEPAIRGTRGFGQRGGGGVSLQGVITS